MNEHISKTKTYLGDLAGIQSKTLRAEKKILESAKARLDVVQAMIKRAQVGVDGASEAAQDRYIALIEERAKLNTVIAKAEVVLRPYSHLKQS